MGSALKSQSFSLMYLFGIGWVKASVPGRSVTPLEESCIHACAKASSQPEICALECGWLQCWWQEPFACCLWLNVVHFLSYYWKRIVETSGTLQTEAFSPLPLLSSFHCFSFLHVYCCFNFSFSFYFFLVSFLFPLFSFLSLVLLFTLYLLGFLPPWLYSPFSFLLSFFFRVSMECRILVKALHMAQHGYNNLFKQTTQTLLFCWISSLTLQQLGMRLPYILGTFPWGKVNPYSQWPIPENLGLWCIKIVYTVLFVVVVAFKYSINNQQWGYV